MSEDQIKSEFSEDQIKEELVKLSNEQMFSVDYTQAGCFSAELSFTTLDLIILEKIIKDKTYDFSNVPRLQRLQMAFNVFPRIKGVFHYLSEYPNVCEISLINDIFDSAKSGEVKRIVDLTIPIF